MFTALCPQAPLPKARALLPMLCPWGVHSGQPTLGGVRVVGVSPELQSVVGTRVASCTS